MVSLTQKFLKNTLAHVLTIIIYYLSIYQKNTYTLLTIKDLV